MLAISMYSESKARRTGEAYGQKDGYSEHRSFKEFALSQQSAATIAILATACCDLQRINSYLAQALDANSANPNSKSRGDAVYAIWMAIGHFNEALDIIGLIKNDTYIMAVLNSCDHQTVSEFNYFRTYKPGPFLERLRNGLAFHYKGSGKLYSQAIQKRTAADHFINKVRASHMSDWHWKFADDIVETIVAGGATGQKQDDARLSLTDDEIGKEISALSADMKMFLSFSGELIWAFR